MEENSREHLQCNARGRKNAQRLNKFATLRCTRYGRSMLSSRVRRERGRESRKKLDKNTLEGRCCKLIPGCLEDAWEACFCFHDIEK